MDKSRTCLNVYLPFHFPEEKKTETIITAICFLFKSHFVVKRYRDDKVLSEINFQLGLYSPFLNLNRLYFIAEVHMPREAYCWFGFVFGATQFNVLAYQIFDTHG